MSLGSDWAINSAPVAATQATASKAAQAGFRHKCTGFSLGIDAVAAQGDIVFNLRDGATGAGTILWSMRLSAAAGTSRDITVAGLSIGGSGNTAMTLETVGAPAATNFAYVNLTGATEPAA